MFARWWRFHVSRRWHTRIWGRDHPVSSHPAAPGQRQLRVSAVERPKRKIIRNVHRSVGWSPFGMARKRSGLRRMQTAVPVALVLTEICLDKTIRVQLYTKKAASNHELLTWRYWAEHGSGDSHVSWDNLDNSGQSKWKARWKRWIKITSQIWSELVLFYTTKQRKKRRETCVAQACSLIRYFFKFSLARFYSPFKLNWFFKEHSPGFD